MLFDEHEAIIRIIKNQDKAGEVYYFIIAEAARQAWLNVAEYYPRKIVAPFVRDLICCGNRCLRKRSAQINK